jgi:hypothetical protein
MFISLEVGVRPADFREQTVSAHSLKSVGIQFSANMSFISRKTLRKEKGPFKN